MLPYEAEERGNRRGTRMYCGSYHSEVWKVSGFMILKFENRVGNCFFSAALILFFISVMALSGIVHRQVLRTIRCLVSRGCDKSLLESDVLDIVSRCVGKLLL